MIWRRGVTKYKMKLVNVGVACCLRLVPKDFSNNGLKKPRIFWNTFNQLINCISHFVLHRMIEKIHVFATGWFFCCRVVFSSPSNRSLLAPLCIFILFYLTRCIVRTPAGRLNSPCCSTSRDNQNEHR